LRQLQDDQKVFGIGLSKTGTTSLAKALNILGIASVHFPHDDRTFAELQRREYRLSILDEYQGATDTPVAAFFAQLDEAWPGSKFILTVRDKASWLRSADAHWRAMETGRPGRDPGFRGYVDFINTCVYGGVDFSAERFSDVYDAHVRNVTEYFAHRPDDLLVLNICGGTASWAELCGFLGVPVPRHDPFPHEHRTNQWARMLLEAGKDLSLVVPAGETVIVIDQQALGDEFAEGRRRLPFLERNGEYWGEPADDDSAIAELERQRGETGATFVALAWPAFWWFEHYTRFIAHLESNYDCVLRTERLVVWALQ
jgi:hypothetical protein